MYLDAIRKKQPQMLSILEAWANINSGTENLSGLAQMHQALEGAFTSLNCKKQSITLPSYTKIDSNGQPVQTPVGNALRFFKHTNAPKSILLGGHMDTVYHATSPFQKTERLNTTTLRGPGVADMKGGLVVMLTALEIFQNIPHADQLDWEVIISPDEEIGSPSSEFIWKQAAKRNAIGLIFEPSFPDGALVSTRKGSANFTVVSRGKAAHSGRDFHQGRNAITAIARFILEAERLNDAQKGITLNIGKVEGGTAVNIVPDLAICKLNLRIVEHADLSKIHEELNKIITLINQTDGIHLTLHEHSSRPPKQFDDKQNALFTALRASADEMGLKLLDRPSGGVCDGNLLLEEGLPNIDTLGVVGGNIHTPDEYMLIDSLTERTALTVNFMTKIAMKEWSL